MISLNPVFSTTILRKIACFASATLGNDLYYMKEVIDLMISIVGEEQLIIMLKRDSNAQNVKIGENWYKLGGMKEKLRRFDKIIENTKSIYDTLEEGEKKDIESKPLLDKARRISLIKPDVYNLFVFLINNSSIQRMSIPGEFFKILEHKQHKPLQDFDKERPYGRE